MAPVMDPVTWIGAGPAAISGPSYVTAAARIRPATTITTRAIRMRRFFLGRFGRVSALDITLYSSGAYLNEQQRNRVCRDSWPSSSTLLMIVGPAGSGAS